jgi:hypothetical protein
MSRAMATTARLVRRHFPHQPARADGQGNHYCNRDYGESAPNQNAYHYSNANGSYYYSSEYRVHSARYRERDLYRNSNSRQAVLTLARSQRLDLLQ